MFGYWPSARNKAFYNGDLDITEPWEVFERITSNSSLEGISMEKDNDQNLWIEVEVPGFNRDNIEITHSGGKLFIEGETKKRNLEKEISLASDREVEKATVQDGLLTLKVPKKTEDRSKIPIE